MTQKIVLNVPVDQSNNTYILKYNFNQVRVKLKKKAS